MNHGDCLLKPKPVLSEETMIKGNYSEYLTKMLNGCLGKLKPNNKPDRWTWDEFENNLMQWPAYSNRCKLWYRGDYSDEFNRFYMKVMEREFSSEQEKKNRDYLLFPRVKEMSYKPALLAKAICDYDDSKTKRATSCQTVFYDECTDRVYTSLTDQYKDRELQSFMMYDSAKAECVTIRVNNKTKCTQDTIKFKLGDKILLKYGLEHNDRAIGKVLEPFDRASKNQLQNQQQSSSTRSEGKNKNEKNDKIFKPYQHLNTDSDPKQATLLKNEKDKQKFRRFLLEDLMIEMPGKIIRSFDKFVYGEKITIIGIGNESNFICKRVDGVECRVRKDIVLLEDIDLG